VGLQFRSKKAYALKTVSALTLSGVVAQVFILFGTLVIARLYSPAQFGYYALLVNISSLLSIVMTLSTEQFIVTAKSNKEAVNIFETGIISATRIFVICSISGIFCSFLFNVFFHKRIFSLDGLILVLLLALVNGLFSLASQLILRKQDFKSIARRGPLQNFGIAFFQFSLAFTNIKHHGLVIGEILGRLIGLIYIWKSFGTIRVKSLTLNKFKRLRIGKQHPTYTNFVSILFDLAAVSSPVFVASFFFGHTEAGQIGMALRLLNLPTILVGVSISQFIYSTATKEMRKGILFSRTKFHKLIGLLFSLGFALMLFICTVGIKFMNGLLGAQWLQASSILKLIAPMFIISFVWNSISNLFYMKGLWTSFLRVTILRLSFILTATMITFIFKSTFEFTMVLIFLANSLALIHGCYILSRSFPLDSKSSKK